MSHNIFYDIAYQCKSKTLKLELTHLAKVVTMSHGGTQDLYL